MFHTRVAEKIKTHILNSLKLFCFSENLSVYNVVKYCTAGQVTHNKWCVQVLRSPKEAFAAAMQSWRERCEKCVCLQGDYVEN